MMDAQALYEDLLAGRLDDAQRTAFAIRLRDDPEFAATLGDHDADELLLVTRMLWADAGGHDSDAPRFEAQRATEAASAGLAQQRARSARNRWLTVGFAAAAGLLAFAFLRPAEPPSSDLTMRGQQADAGVAVDWEQNGKPVLSTDVLPAGVLVAAQWTNPEGRFTHLSLGVEDAAGRWHPLGGKAIDAVEVDTEVKPLGPFPLNLPPGAVKLCGVFSKGTPNAAAPEGVRVCSEVQLGQSDKP